MFDPLIFGTIAGILVFTSHLYYIFGIITGSVRPQRTTWFIIVIISGINVANQLASGVDSGIWAYILPTTSAFLIFAFSISKGLGGVSKLDISILILAGLDLGLWQYFQDPIYSVIMSASTAVLSVTPTAIKVYKKPESENLGPWLVPGLAMILVCLSAEWTPEQQIIPISWAVIDLTMAAFIIKKRESSTQKLAAAA